jgi:hypothetical protein
MVEPPGRRNDYTRKRRMMSSHLDLSSWAPGSTPKPPAGAGLFSGRRIWPAHPRRVGIVLALLLASSCTGATRRRLSSRVQPGRSQQAAGAAAPATPPGTVSGPEHYAKVWWEADEIRSLTFRHDQRGGPLANIVRPAGGAAGIKIEIDTKLAQPRDFGARPRVGHAMDHAQ